MAIKVEDGFNFQISLGGIIFGCAQTVSFGASVEDKDATCTASGGVKETIPGQKSYTLSAASLMRVTTLTDITTNVTSREIEQMFEDREIIDWEFTTTTTGGTKKAGTAYIKSFTESGGTNADAAFSVEFTVTGPVTYTPVA